MRYTCKVEINLPIDKVVELWSDENNFKEWQSGFQSITLLEGEAETKGAKSKIVLQQGKMRLELLETILVSDLPNEKTAIYEHIHMTNTQTSQFKALTENKTEYISEVEYTQFNGFLPKVMSILFPGKFKKQSKKWMVQFKNFAESTT
ncbi:MAG: SRPBCC family protein [Aureispira sp.]|nr:SRPBCC family protein [Aureispira sp.]